MPSPTLQMSTRRRRRRQRRQCSSFPAQFLLMSDITIAPSEFTNALLCRSSSLALVLLMLSLSLSSLPMPMSVVSAIEISIPSPTYSIHDTDDANNSNNSFLIHPFFLNHNNGVASSGVGGSSGGGGNGGGALVGGSSGGGGFPIEDATCDVEQLEKANDSQLHVILDELMTTNFFRSFAVDLDQKCPLAQWNNNPSKKKVQKKTSSSTTTHEKNELKEQMHSTSTSESSSSSRNVIRDSATTTTLPTATTTLTTDAAITAESSNAHQDHEGECAGGLPDLDPDAEPACSVDLGGGGGDNTYTNTLGFLSFGTSSSSSSSSSASGDASIFPSTNDAVVGDVNRKVANAKDDDEEEDETVADEFECSGNNDELDDDAEPLCSLASDGDQTANNLFGSPKSTTSPLSSSSSRFESAALHSISQRVDDRSSWESESQQKTFTWNQVSDPVIESYPNEQPCNDDGVGNLPGTFWLDMCSQIKSGDGLTIVNLRLNPERNTGYNGTHIWNAIYTENCLAVDGSSSAPMCYEERVLYRLLSGLHTSTTLSIAKNYYPPSKKKGRANWEPNPQYFIDKFADHPEQLRNLHFSYVVLLRALKKASGFLYNFEIKTGDIVDDEMATILLRRLLDSSILKSCHDVFTAFDENLMFKEQETAMSLQENFKGVFHNISSILDCVQCQQCKLHGKMAMLGYGTALKILFMPESIVGMSLSRNEIVAFLNTIAKMSESVREVRELTHLYWSTHTVLEKSEDVGHDNDRNAIGSSAGLDGVDVLDAAVGAVSSLANQGFIDELTEASLIQQAFQRHPELMVLSKHYGNDLRKFLEFLPNIDSRVVTTTGDRGDPDAIVVGTGLAGLAAALNILDRGGRVTLIEKEHRMGGNSNKASSGINACCPQNATYGDSLDTFRQDTTRSAGLSARSHLIDVLVENSEAAVLWLKERVGVDLSVLSQLGGHGHKRTHRPQSGMVGAEIIYNIQKAVKKFEQSGMVQILMDTRVTSLKKDENGTVIGVDVMMKTKEGDTKNMTLTSPNVILATGGFASDRSHGSYLEKYRPELMKMPATAGEFSTGDGIALGTSVGAGLVDMEKVQVHPTGWVDPKDPTNPGKILAGELMRGVGGILMNKSGKRFCNELGTRAYVVEKMFSHDRHYNESKTWDINSDIPTFSLVLSSSAAVDAKKHVDHYLNKGLLTKLEGLNALSEWMNVPVITVKETLREYQRDAKRGKDQWGKTSFAGVPQNDLSKEIFYAGTVTPVLHYCMGGLTIDKNGSVLDENENIIPGLHAAGEVSGGVHGDNRLGGNSLLECTVFGSIVGKKIPIQPRTSTHQLRQSGTGSIKGATDLPKLTMDDVRQHNSEDDCWIAIHGKVYDLTDFAEEHPAGPESILELAGQDGTEAFQAVHSEGVLEEFEPIGIL